MKSIKITLLGALLAAAFALSSFSAHAQNDAPVYMEDMTWQEIEMRFKGGASIVLVPTGATEQEGPHMEVGAHNYIMRNTAGEIARRLGNALVAPNIPFAPSGRVSPPEGHMLFMGTISITDYAYGVLLEDVARSLKQHGFRMICLLGDAAGSQKTMAQVADKLGREWKTDGVRVLYVSNYFNKNGQDEWSDTMPNKVANVTAHGGHIETSELMAVDAAGVRDNMRIARTERDFKTTGAAGDSSMASAAYGKKYLSLKIEAAIKQIQNASSNAKPY